MNDIGFVSAMTPTGLSHKPSIDGFIDSHEIGGQNAGHFSQTLPTLLARFATLTDDERAEALSMLRKMATDLAER